MAFCLISPLDRRRLGAYTYGMNTKMGRPDIYTDAEMIEALLACGDVNEAARRVGCGSNALRHRIKTRPAVHQAHVYGKMQANLSQLTESLLAEHC